MASDTFAYLGFAESEVNLISIQIDDVTSPTTMIADRLDEIPAVAIAVFKHDHGAVGLEAGLFGHADATLH